MTQVVVSALADSDRDEIVSHLATNAGYRTAERYDAEFKAAYRRLVDFPASGSPRKALGASVRIVVIDPYVVIYEYRGDTVRILRVLHGRRDIMRRLVGGEDSL